MPTLQEVMHSQVHYKSSLVSSFIIIMLILSLRSAKKERVRILLIRIYAL